MVVRESGRQGAKIYLKETADSSIERNTSIEMFLKSHTITYNLFRFQWLIATDLIHISRFITHRKNFPAPILCS